MTGRIGREAQRKAEIRPDVARQSRLTKIVALLFRLMNMMCLQAACRCEKLPE